MNPPDFKTWQERDAYFKDHADYYTVIKKDGVGTYDREEHNKLEDAIKAAQTRALIGGGRYMIYAVIGQQSAFVISVPESNTKKGK